MSTFDKKSDNIEANSSLYNPLNKSRLELFFDNVIVKIVEKKKYVEILSRKSPLSIRALLFSLVGVILFIYSGENFFSEEAFKIFDLVAFICSLSLISIFVLLMIFLCISVLINIYFLRNDENTELIIENIVVDLSKNDKINIKIKLKKFLLLPFISINSFPVFGKTKLVYGNRTIEKNALEKIFCYEYSYLNRAKIDIKQINIKIEDILGLFRYRKEIDCDKNIFVIPKIKELNDFLIYSSYSDESNDSELKKQNSDEDFDIRKYEPGDDLRKIHWKMYAKKRELYIRHPEIDEPVLSDFVLYSIFSNSLDRISDSYILNGYLNYNLLVLNSFVDNLSDKGLKTYTKIAFNKNIFKIPNDKSEFQKDIAGVNWHSNDEIIYDIKDFISKLEKHDKSVNNINIFINVLFTDALENLINKIYQLEREITIYISPVKSFFDNIDYDMLNNRKRLLNTLFLADINNVNKGMIINFEDNYTKLKAYLKNTEKKVFDFLIIKEKILLNILREKKINYQFLSFK